MVITDIHKELRMLLLMEGLSQADLANRMGVSRSYVNTIVGCKVKPVSSQLVTITEALGYDIELKFVRRDEQ